MLANPPHRPDEVWGSKPTHWRKNSHPLQAAGQGLPTPGRGIRRSRRIGRTAQIERTRPLSPVGQLHSGLF